MNRTLYGVCGLFVFATSVHSSNIDKLLSRYPESVLAEKEYKSHGQYDLLDGKISYVVESGQYSNEGYAPDSSVPIEGEVYKAVYDHKHTDSATSIASEIGLELERKGFDLVFSCKSRECGDVAGWRLYFSQYIDGPIDSQHYILATHPNKKKGDWFVAFYVNEFTGRPRSIVHIVDTREISMGNYEIEASELGVWLSHEEHDYFDTIFFSFDSANLDKKSKNTLSLLADKLKADRRTEVLIEGHSDDVGAETYNQTLSESRAKVVFDYLLSMGVERSQLSMSAYGETRSKGGRKPLLSRRVDIKRLSNSDAQH